MAEFIKELMVTLFGNRSWIGILILAIFGQKLNAPQWISTTFASILTSFKFVLPCQAGNGP